MLKSVFGVDLSALFMTEAQATQGGRMSRVRAQLTCWLRDHDWNTVEVLWGGHDYERITSCRRCGAKQ
jgi:hypothetical protein